MNEIAYVKSPMGSTASVVIPFDYQSFLKKLQASMPKTKPKTKRVKAWIEVSRKMYALNKRADIPICDYEGMLNVGFKKSRVARLSGFGYITIPCTITYKI